jgi:hypothetical protein
MASPEEIRAYIDSQVNARVADQVNARVAELQANFSRASNVKPPKPITYDARHDPELWLYSVDTYYSAVNLTNDAAKISFADALLRGDALTWRRTIDMPSDWDSWKTLLISAFQPVNPSETARDRLARLRQTTSVRAYVAIFRTVCLLIPMITEDEKKDRFIRGLKPKIMNELRIKPQETFEETVKMAVRLDTLDTWRPSYNNNHNNARPSSSSRGGAPVPMEVDLNAITPAAVRSNVNALHNTNSRPSYRDAAAGSNRPSNSRPPRRPLTDREREDFRRRGICFKCRQPGHIARECPESSN